jgi:Protein of unknown function (DUF3618)
MAQGSDEVAEGPVHMGTADGIASAPTSEEIRSHIEQTRAEMSETIDAIQSRLNPKRVLTDAGAAMTDAAVGRARHLTDRTYGLAGGVLQRVQDNPLPVALVASAAAGLLVLDGNVDEYRQCAFTT